ncbi:MAG: ligand-gated channel protein [Alloalcanivorax venustensis]|jgi:outer membrane receptor for ferrienterochelin and colicins|uniref:ligand-gated channel protein n=1 Tax=Alloalcanivorax venustensis TaxID=172371 RepID=UPI002E8347B8|nr:ligand-gated channel protein [Pseudomonadota bacterium]MEE3010598.1 ligand-gated channel protein [Pseudomonadota bacterium]
MRFALWGAAALLAAGPVLAESGDGHELGQVTVTASGHAQQLEDAPASISVITREQIEQRYYQDATDALRDIPGVIITGGGSGDRGNDIVIRGMPSQYTLILVDGKPVSTRETRPNGSAGFEQDWLPPLQSIERIEVVRGPMSTLYGSDAIGGVINVITRKVAEEWGGAVQLDTIIQDDSRSGDIQQGNFSLSGPLLADTLGLQVYGRASSRQEDRFVDGFEEKNLKNLNARLSFTPTDNQDFTLEAGQTKQDRRSLIGYSAPATGCRGGCTDSDNEYTREVLALNHTGRWDFGTTDSYVQREEAENLTREMKVTNTSAKTALVAPLGDHLLTVGANFEKEELSDRTSNQISNRTEVDASKWALFAEDEWMLPGNVSVTGGVRLDDDENYGSHVSPRLYGVWGMAPRWTLKGGVSTGFRSPSLREITPDWGQVSRGGDVYGNPDLEPETSVNKELGLYFNAGRDLQANVTVFHNDFKDKITRIACPPSVCPGGPNQFGSDPTYRVNVDEAVTRGVEAAVSTTLARTLDLTLSYTYTDSEQQSGEYEGEPLNQVPKHLASLQADWRVTSRLSPWLAVRYRGEESQPTTGPSSSSIVAPSNTLVDAGLAFKLTPQATLNTGIYNIADKEIFQDEYGYVEDGRRYWLGMRVSF